MQGVILESGTVFSFPNRDKASAAAQWFNISGALGCGDASAPPDQVLACMRGKSADDVVGVLPPAQILLTGTLPWGPVVDDTIAFANYTGRVPAPLPVLVGSCDYEAGLFELADKLVGVSESQAFWDSYTLWQFTCPTAQRAAVGPANQIPTWRYRYFGVFPNTTETNYTGAYHGSDVSARFRAASFFVPR